MKSLCHLKKMLDEADEILRKIRFLVFDFDGVMTDNRVLVDECGHESVFCSRSDGMGIECLRKRTRVEMLVLSKEQNPVTSARCRKLGLRCIQGMDDKLVILQQEIKNRGLLPENVAFVGNDINDIPCLDCVGIPIVVADCHEYVKSHALFITEKNGGYGAVREVCDAILASWQNRESGRDDACY